MKDTIAASLSNHLDDNTSAAEIAQAILLSLEAGPDYLGYEFLELVRRECHLPPSAPETYVGRVNRKETPISMMKRVWGAYIESGVLYQDDISRLGDTKLVAAVRSYCCNNHLDPVFHLPPARSVRFDRALSKAPAGGISAEFLKARIGVRGRSAKKMRESRALKKTAAERSLKPD